jgi:signal transduction histidine kinase
MNRTNLFQPQGVFRTGFFYLTFLLFLVFPFFTSAQDVQHALIKTFDPALNKITNIEVSVNGKGFVKVGAKGEALVELHADDIPIRAIKIKDEALEVASWNYSKGVIEVIVRKKTYKTAVIYVQDTDNSTIRNASVTFKGTRSVTLVTDDEGKVTFTLALDEKVNSSDQFTVTDFQVVNLLTSESRSVLTVRKPKPVVRVQEIVKNKNEFPVDSIQSLEQFYALFKNYQTEDLTPGRRAALNAKLKELMQQFEDSVRATEVQHMVKITDSSTVKEDIRNIISQATIENSQLAKQRDQFNEKIRVINQKLSKGVLNIKGKERAELLADITRLEIVLESNRSSFYKNQEDYRAILNTIKEKFLQIEDLEHKLSESETQRQEDKEAFQRKMIIIVSIAVFSSMLGLLLFYFSSELRRQKKELVQANEEVKHVNENLERLVQERTHRLEETNRELDIFLYKASHNLRAPVSSMMGLYNISTHPAGKDSRELIERGATIAHSMDRLLRKLRVISEINLKHTSEDFALQPLLTRIRSQFDPVIRAAGISFSIECPENVTLHSTKNLVTEILISLIENAIFFCSIKDTTDREVKVKASVVSGATVIEVYDNGVGINPALQTQVFDMFYVGNERSDGNGLGLYIVQKALQILNGSVHVESEPGSFSRFVVRIPASPQVNASVSS